MNILTLPFNRLIEIQLSDRDGFLLMLTDSKKYTNHLETVHASALFALAEASAGQFLLSNFPESEMNITPVVRQVSVKYKKPAIGPIYSSVTLVNNDVEHVMSELKTRGRVQLTVKVELFDSNQILVFTGDFEWFVAVNPS
jgi:acyl-coenzyme A thioesterase PaaI-like protein